MSYAESEDAKSFDESGRPMPTVSLGSAPGIRKFHRDYVIVSFTFLKILFALVFSPHSCLRVGVRSPGTGIIDSCELPFGCWDLDLGPLEEQPIFNH